MTTRNSPLSWPSRYVERMTGDADLIRGIEVAAVESPDHHALRGEDRVGENGQDSAGVLFSGPAAYLVPIAVGLVIHFRVSPVRVSGELLFTISNRSGSCWRT